MTKMLGTIGVFLFFASIALFYLLDGEMALFVGFTVLGLSFVVMFISDRLSRE